MMMIMMMKMMEIMTMMTLLLFTRQRGEGRGSVRAWSDQPEK